MRYVALLRGVNVGGKNTVSMARLRELFEEAGHTGVRTYVNSGNVVFDAPRQRTADLAREAERVLADEVGVAVRVLVLRGSAVVDIAAALPQEWLDDAGSSCNVMYLMPERANPRAVGQLSVDTGHEDVVYRAGAIVSRIDVSRVGHSSVHLLNGTPLAPYVTIRNGRTAHALARLVQEDP